MQEKINEDSSVCEKVLRLFQRLMLDGRKHFQTDLAEWLQCSVQTVMRLIAEIEAVIGANLVTGLEKHRRWYQIRSISRNKLGLDFEELRYLAICRDLAEPFLPDTVKKRVENSIFSFSMLMADQEFAEREKVQKKHMGYCAKGWIDYSPYHQILEKLVNAVEEKKICLVRYKSPSSRQSKEHRFIPVRIVAMNNALYALGADLTEDFSQMRFFTNMAVHRIKDVTVTDRICTFDIPQGDMNMFGLPWHEPRKFRIHFNSGKVAEYVRERIWSDKQKIKRQPDGSIVLEIISRSQPEIEAWVRSFGNEAKLLDEIDEQKA